MSDPKNEPKEPSLFGFEEPPKAAYPDEFGRLWKAYPNPKGKIKTLQLCQRMIQLGEANWEDLIVAAANYAKEVAGKDRQYIKHASTFYGRSGYWRDYIEPTPDGSKEHPFLIHAKRMGRG